MRLVGVLWLAGSLALCTGQFVVATLLILPAYARANNWAMQPVSIPTRWAKLVSPTNALPEYPRPQLVRAQWQNLNGLWDYTITPIGEFQPRHYRGKILVPFPLEAALSGVEGKLAPDQWLWYRRSFTVHSRANGKHVLLHFGAVDFEAAVIVNGRRIGEHRGGYTGFSLDITEALKPGVNQLVVRVWNPIDLGPNPHGKQGIQHTPSSGIWQTVWLESVPASYIERLKMVPDVDRGSLHLAVSLVRAQPGDIIEAIVCSGGRRVAHKRFQGATDIAIPTPHLWSPDDPFLYDLKVSLIRGTQIVDHVSSYFGMRKIEVKPDAAGVFRIFLNGHYTYNLGTLDRGWWPDGVYTAPTDAALKFDIEATKAMGFNTIRKHVKVEPDRWYYYCDKLGVLVWQDMVNPAEINSYALTSEARAEFEGEVGQTIGELYDHPSIVTWILFNEVWGPYDQGRLAHWIKRLDPSRLVDARTGPEDYLRSVLFMRELDPELNQQLTRPWILEALQKAIRTTEWVGGDFADVHHYPDPRLAQPQSGKARVAGEYGGVGVLIEGHRWNDLDPGYSMRPSSPDKFLGIYSDYLHRLKTLEAKGLSASIYTNPFDVEDGEYGLMTYDRAVIKIPVTELLRLNTTLVHKAGNYATATRDFSAIDADTTPEAQIYAGLRKSYRKGQGDPALLRRLTLMALRQNDQERATVFGNAYIAQLPKPYSNENWRFIVAVTRTSQDAGFTLLKANVAAVDAVLGANTAETVIRDVALREAVTPYTAGRQKSDWNAAEHQAETQFGALGTEAFDGARMIDVMENRDGAAFGRYFALYYRTALTRSAYPINAVAWRLCRESHDLKAFQAAIRAIEWARATGTRLFNDDPTLLDTYACLLEKAARPWQALYAAERAVHLSGGRDTEIAARLTALRRKRVTSWTPADAACEGLTGEVSLCGLESSEDLAAVPNSPWLIASGLADQSGMGGALYLIDRRDNSWKPLFPRGAAPQVAGSSAASGSGSAEPVSISAHGIHLREDSPQRYTLYVVNHAGRESVEIFDLDVSGDPALHWRRSLVLPGKAYGNSVAPLPDGGLVVAVSFVTDDKNLADEVQSGQPTGYVLEWHAQSGWSRVSDSEGSFPNGIEVSPDGNWLYLTNTGTQNIVRLSRRTPERPKTAIALQMRTDNVHWGPDGQLWIAGQLGVCFPTKPVCDVDYKIVRLDPATLRTTEVPHPRTAPYFGGVSTVLPVGGDIWLGSYLADRIVRFPMPNLHASATGRAE